MEIGRIRKDIGANVRTFRKKAGQDRLRVFPFKQEQLLTTDTIEVLLLMGRWVRQTAHPVSPRRFTT